MSRSRSHNGAGNASPAQQTRSTMRPKSLIARLACCLALAFIYFTATGCAVIEGSGNVITFQEDIGNKVFTNIRVRSAFRLNIQRGDTPGVKLEIDDNLRAFLNIEIDNDTLEIGLIHGVHYQNATAVATVTLPKLNRLRLSGASQATLGGIPCDENMEIRLSGASRLIWDGELSLSSIDIEASGASRVTFGNLNAKTSRIDLSGASQLTLKGSGTGLELEASGASLVKMIEFALNTAKVRLSGASKAELQVVDSLDGKLSGASQLLLLGTPTQKVDTSGASQVRKYSSAK